MVDTDSHRKTRSDKFPLTLHLTGQYCKKIRGKLYYFGTDKAAALERYLEEATCLHAGKIVKARFLKGSLSIKTLCNLYLNHQESRAAVGEVELRYLYDQTSLLRDFVRFVGPNRNVADISTLDLQSYRKKLIKAGKAPNTVNNRIAAVKAVHNWAVGCAQDK